MVHFTDFDFGFRPHVGPRSIEKLGTSFSCKASQDDERREKGKSGLFHACLAFTSPSNVIDIQSESSNLFSIVCVCAAMIACENKDCPIERFHFQCVGLSTAPSGEWFCEQYKRVAMGNLP